MEPIYYYNGVARASYWWANPNHAGIVLAYLVPFLWIVFWRERRVAIRGIVFGIEVVIYYMVSKTLSRGAIAALTLGIACDFVLCAFKCRPAPIRAVAGALGARLLALVVAVVSTGLYSRAAPAALTHDNSILHRVELWKGALEMIRDHWAVGVPWNTAGEVCGSWYARPSEVYVYTGLVNGILEFASELGIPVLFIAFWLIGYLIVAAAASARHHNQGILADVLASCICVIAIMLAANTYATAYKTWYFSVGFVLPAAVILVVRRHRHRPSLSPHCMWATPALAVIMVTPFLCYCCFVKPSVVRVEAWRATITVGLRSSPNAKSVSVFLDRQLSARYLRPAFESLVRAHPDVKYVVAGKPPPGPPSQAAIFYGSTVGYLDRRYREHDIAVLAPQLFEPNADLSMVRYISLPASDIAGQNTYWEKLAHKNNIPITHFTSARWPIEGTSLSVQIEHALQILHAI